MKTVILWIALFSFLFARCGQKKAISVSKIELDLSAFGVESDGYPSIHVFINLETDSSACKKSYYSGKYQDSIYSLSKTEIQQISLLLKHADIAELKKSYADNRSDQPTSTATFYTNAGDITIKDYGLNGEYPLRELYRIAYKGNNLF